MLQRYRLALYTFGAVFLVVAAVCALTLPPLLDLAQQTYYELQQDVTERQARAMEQFVRNRLDRGIPPSEVIEEFQAAVEGSAVDRGYVCLIDQEETSYLSHPDRETLGMSVKPGSMFDRDFGGDGIDWGGLLTTGEQGGGLLDIGQGTMQEVIYFMTVPGTGWTVSAHENTARIDREIQTLRRSLTLFGLLFGVLLAVPASIAARRVSRRHEDSVERTNRLERKLLESENQRKADELESARKLQLSMLPRHVPEHPELELATEVQTATEVGGDYHDFDLQEDGTLTMIVGDATGHGLQAGTLVATVKGLFTLCARDEDLSEILEQIGTTLVRVGLPRLLMAAGVVRYREGKLSLAGSGLPPALLFRAETGTVEPISLDGIPLGSRMRSRAETTTRELKPRDTVALLTDGLPELLNPEGEELGYERLAEHFGSIADGPAEAITAGFRELATSWSRERAYDDDITIAVLKVKPNRA